MYRVGVDNDSFLDHFWRESGTVSAVSFRAFTVRNVTSCLNGWRWTFDAWHFMTQQQNHTTATVHHGGNLTSAHRCAGNLDVFDTKGDGLAKD